MDYKKLNVDEEVVIDIDGNNGGSVSENKRGKKTLSKLVSGVLGYHELSEVGDSAIEMVVDGSSSDGQELLPVIENGKRKGGKSKRAPKPPRPPKGPFLDAADMRLVREFTRIAMQKRERIERMKALKKMKSVKPPSSAPSSGNTTISALVITVLFFLVLIFQGLGCSNSSRMTTRASPQPAPETKGLISVQFSNPILSNDGVVPNQVSPRFTRKLIGSEFSSPE